MKIDQVQEDEIEYESSNEVNYTDFVEYSKDELAQTLIKYILYEQDYLSKINFLKKTIRDLTLEKEHLEESNNAFHTKIETLEIENKELQSKCESLEKVVLRFSKGQDNLDKLLGSQKISLTQKLLDIILLTKRKHTKISLFKRHPKTTLTSYAITV